MATTRFGISPISASGTAAEVMATPNSRRLLKPRMIRMPRNIPAASPKKIPEKTTPQPALPPCRVFLT